MKRALAVFVLLLAAVPLVAQTGNVIDYRLEVYDAAVDAYGAGDPIKSGTIPASAVVCNQVPPTLLTLTTANPKRVFWPDPTAPTKVCVASTTLSIWFTPEEATGHTYVFTITPIDDRQLNGPRSAASNPFVIAPPAGVGPPRSVP